MCIRNSAVIERQDLLGAETIWIVFYIMKIVIMYNWIEHEPRYACRDGPQSMYQSRSCKIWAPKSIRYAREITPPQYTAKPETCSQLRLNNLSRRLLSQRLLIQLIKLLPIHLRRRRPFQLQPVKPISTHIKRRPSRKSERKNTHVGVKSSLSTVNGSTIK